MHQQIRLPLEFVQQKYGFMIDLNAAVPNLIQQNAFSRKVLLKQGEKTGELAFGIPHKKAPALFYELKDDGLSLDKKHLDRLIAGIILIMQKNPDYSNWAYNKQNSVNVHVPEGSCLESLLNDETRLRKLRWFRWQLDRSGQKPTERIIERIQSEDDLMYALRFVDHGQRESFIRETKVIISELERRYQKLKEVSRLACRVEKELRNLEKETGTNISSVRKALRSATGLKPMINNLPASETIEIWYRKHQRCPYNPAKIKKEIPSIGVITRMKTRLSDYTNKLKEGYSPDIITFKIKEPYYSKI